MPTVMGGSGLLCEAVPEAPAVSVADVGATSAPAWFGSVGFGGLGSNDPGRDVDAAMTMTWSNPHDSAEPPSAAPQQPLDESHFRNGQRS